MSGKSAWWSSAKARVAGMVIRALYGTYREVPSEGSGQLKALRQIDEPFILCFWHNRILCGTYYFRGALMRRGNPVRVMISRSADGELISRLVEAWGAIPARGSTSRGGSAALRKLAREIRQGPGLVVMTPDGPRGPVYRAQPGTILMAQLAGVPIYPMGCSAERLWRLGSWDRFMVPKPFSRITIALGEPVRVSRELDEAGREEARLQLEEGLLKADREAARAFGVSAE